MQPRHQRPSLNLKSVFLSVFFFLRFLLYLRDKFWLTSKILCWVLEENQEYPDWCLMLYEPRSEVPFQSVQVNLTAWLAPSERPLAQASIRKTVKTEGRVKLVWTMPRCILFCEHRKTVKTEYNTKQTGLLLLLRCILFCENWITVKTEGRVKLVWTMPRCILFCEHRKTVKM